MLSKKILILTLVVAFSMPRVCFGDDILLKPDTCYYLSPDPDVEAKAFNRAVSDDSADSEDSGSEDSDTYDENSDNSSNEDEADTETNTDTNVQCENTTVDPFRALNEISQYCAAQRQRLEMIKQKTILDSEIPTESELGVTEADFVNNQGVTSPTYSTDQMGHLKTHKQGPKRPKLHQCGHEGCDYSTDRSNDLKKHKQTHLPADQRPKVHKCDHKGCNYSTDRAGHLKTHKRIHLPANQILKRVKRLERLKRRKLHQCDHEGCNYSTYYAGNLKPHKQTHLPANQRPKRAKVHQCDHEGCDYSTDRSNDLKKHKQTHLPAGQRAKRTKRKAYDQLLSNEKRKKSGEE
ncbi:hypothetical protein [Endozoicomonas sp. 4G]|uniref:hypothetical protein n=1 Tax=Endozoicomonas sp. 4G TaxID=2872754 RepID=UPI002078D367|nr:hypothetical protein [Endozoicomonas sp. 4G]